MVTILQSLEIKQDNQDEPPTPKETLQISLREPLKLPSVLSAYAFMGFICNEEVSVINEGYYPIPDDLRRALNRYWNEGEFIGSGVPIEKNKYRDISFYLLSQKSPVQRIEGVALSAGPELLWSTRVRVAAEETQLLRPEDEATDSSRARRLAGTTGQAEKRQTESDPGATARINLEAFNNAKKK